MNPYLLAIRYRHVLWKTTFTEIKSKYAGSALGLAWAAVLPIVFLVVYAGVFIFIYNVKFQLFSTNEYVLLIFCGLIPFLGFSESINFGTASVVANSSLIKNTLFPPEVLVVKNVIASQVTQGIGFLLLFMGAALIGTLSWWALFAIPLWILQILFTLGLVWFLSSLTVFVRDTQYMVNIAILLLMMASPIAYTSDMIPPRLQPVMKINPLYFFIESYRDVIIHHRQPRFLIEICLLSFGSLHLGHWFFNKLKKVFAENV